MPKERNPSPTMSVEAVDNVVDRLLRGKYEKRNPVEPIEVIRAGFINSMICSSYVSARWARPWDSRLGAPEGTLSPAGVTMRSNKLWERCSPIVHRFASTDNEELVWRVYDSRTHETVCFAPGGREGAKQWAFTLFGWTLPEGTTVTDFRTDLSSVGGVMVASSLNMNLVGRLNERIQELEREAQRKIERAEKLRSMIDAVTGAAAHLIGGASL